MLLTYLMLFVALCLSAVAAFYSIIGLTAIFAAAVWPIVIMGTILEAAKLVVTVWLHEYWRKVKLTMKIYLVPAVFTLMVITSMGIFGFLSKAHLDQTVPTGDVQAQVALIDEKIANERDTIANARTLMAQLDKAVLDISNTPDREVNGRVISSAERALQVRRQQAADRARLSQTIEQSQARIVKLQEEKAPFAKDLRKIEAEVGPIKYIAALIYGDNPDANLLEKAVRWVIIILVIVFDPLAIMMLLAATESYRWERQRREALLLTAQTSETESMPDPTLNPAAESGPVLEANPPELGPKPDNPVDYKVLDDISEPDYAEPPENPTSLEKLQVTGSNESTGHDDTDMVSNEPNNTIKEAMKKWKSENPTKTLKEQRHRLELGLIDQLPWMTLIADNAGTREIATGFGTVFPDNPVKGDVFVRVDKLPNTVFKYNGNAWIEVDKNQNTSYTYDEAYIDYLIDQIGQGTYDPELLSQTESDLIAQRISQQGHT
jgi:hypothetical protein